MPCMLIFQLCNLWIQNEDNKDNYDAANDKEDGDNVDNDSDYRDVIHQKREQHNVRCDFKGYQSTQHSPELNM